MTRVLLVANGELDAVAARRLKGSAFDRIIAVDGGAEHCLALGLRPDLLLGDLDSVAPATLEHDALSAVACERHPARKDKTDLELALLRAVQDGATHLVLAGALGGRFDMTLANVLLLALPQLRALTVEVWDRGQTVRLLSPPGGEVLGRPGDTLSLLPLLGDAEGVSTTSLDYPLRDETLRFGRTRGLSNVLTGSRATLQLRAGLLLAVHTAEGPRAQEEC
jgi:thiamine pyrophosphokinase